MCRSESYLRDRTEDEARPKGDDVRPGGNKANAPDESWAACAYREVSIKDPGNEQAGVDARSIGQ